MKKVLFIIPELSHGGTNKCLENLLPFISNKYQIHIISLEKEGIYKDLFADRLIFLNNIFYLITKSFAFKVINKIDSKIGNKILCYIFKKEIPKIKKSINPDIVIAFQEGTSTLLASLFQTYKIAWIHCDYKLYREEVTNQDEYPIYNKYNKIICVSQSTLNSFCAFYPKLNIKSSFIYNIIDSNKIISKANKDISDRRFYHKKDTFIILSIGRYCPVKQFEKIPFIVNDILKKDKNINIRWYIIGDGNKKLMSYTNKFISKYKLENNVILLGAKSNPYPYIKASNLIVSLSTSEAYPNVINEGKILHIPILSTNYPSAVELIEDGYTGLIRNINDFPNTIIDLINNKDNIYQNIKRNIDKFKYNNNDILLGIKMLLKQV